MRLIFSIIIAFVLSTMIGCKSDTEQGKHRSHQKENHSLHAHHSPSGEIDSKEYRDSETLKMAEELADHYKAINPMKSFYKNKERAQMMDAKRQSSTNISEQLNLTLKTAYEYVLAGENQKSLALYDAFYKQVEELPVKDKQTIINTILSQRAMTHFRTGELDNCLHNHNESSCILPFEPESFHQLTTGSNMAIKDILKVLETSQDDNLIWLLNVAYMTLGQYPDEVPSKWLRPLTPKEPKNNLNKFTNIGSSIGVDDNKLSGGVAIDDFSGDGYPDIISSSWSLQDQIVYYISQGDGTFKESHIAAGLKGITGGLNILHADYNNDGHLDVLILRGAWLKDSGLHPNSLLKNNGNNTFTDVTKSSGLYSLHPTQTATWADFNNDGWLDLYIGNETSNTANDHHCELFLNQKNGTFKEVGQEVGAGIVGFIKGVAVADADNDGDQDLFISNMNRANFFLRNDKDNSALGFHFTDVTAATGLSLPLQSFPCWFWDYNNDGREDLFVASYSAKYFNNVPSEYLKELNGQSFDSETPKLYRNDGDLNFTDVTKSAGLEKVIFAMGSSFGDLNNDGYLDMYIGTGEPDLKAVIPNRAFINKAGKKFEEVTTALGVGHVQKGHAISIADIDLDGDQDIYAVMGGAYEGDIFFNALFENPGQGNDWLRVKLVGVQSNNAAFGARVKLNLGGDGVKQSIYRTISSGSSFGENPSTVEIGIPSNKNILSIEIQWPATGQKTYTGLEKNQAYTIIENEREIIKSTQKPLEFVLNKTHHHHH